MKLIILSLFIFLNYGCGNGCNGLINNIEKNAFGKKCVEEEDSLVGSDNTNNDQGQSYPAITVSNVTHLNGTASGSTNGKSVVVDNYGNIYVAGNTNIGLDGTSAVGTFDLFLTKYTNSGTKAWTVVNGVAGSQVIVRGGAHDSEGNIYISGHTNGNLDGETNTGIHSAVLTKYNSSGTRVWTKLLGVSTKVTYGLAVTVDSNDNIFICGQTSGALHSETLNGNDDLFISKYSTSGVRSWSKLYGVAGGTTKAYGVSTDSSGNIYIAGTTTGNLQGQTKTGSQDGYVMKLNSAGAHIWTKLFGAAGFNTVFLDLSFKNNIYVTGYSYSGYEGETGSSAINAIISKVDTGGNKLWSKLSGVNGSNIMSQAVAVDSNENIYITGLANGDFDGQTRTGSVDTFTIKYDNSGIKSWTKFLGTKRASNIPTDTNGVAIDIDHSDNIYVTGDTSGNFNAGNSVGNDDLFVTTFFNF